MAASNSKLYIGLMSGTSLDGIDGVLADFSNGAIKVLQHAALPFPVELRQEFLALNTSGHDEIHRAALAGNALARLYAQVVREILATSGVPANQVAAIGAHGQTVRHRPQEFDLAAANSSGGGAGYTVQTNNPALLAELTGIDVVADFRSRDVAAGGQGAPLVPAFHREVFGRPYKAVTVLNLGGIANVSLIPAQTALDAADVLGFDTGPANVFLDHWVQKHLGKTFDEGGQWAASGQVSVALLQRMLADPFFTKAPPKSTGRDLFNVGWLDKHLAQCPGVSAVDVQTTLAELTIRSTVDCIKSYQNNSELLLVCGGGALNLHLMTRLKTQLPGLQLASSGDFGLPPLQVESAAFAWLAHKAVRRETGNLPKVTGAKKGAKQGTRILGAIYPA